MLQIDPNLFFGFAGQDAVIDDDSINGKTIRCIFEEPFQAVSQFDGGVEMSAPAVLVADSDLENIAEHDRRIYVNSTDYIITGIQPDGTGLTRLTLREG